MEGTTPIVSPKVNGLGVIIMCQYRFISSTKCTILGVDVNNGGGCARVRAEGLWEISAIYSKFFCEPKIALEKIKY